MNLPITGADATTSTFAEPLLINPVAPVQRISNVAVVDSGALSSLPLSEADPVHAAGVVLFLLARRAPSSS